MSSKALQLMGWKPRGHVNVSANRLEHDLEEGADYGDSEVAPLISPSSLSKSRNKGMERCKLDALVVRGTKVEVQVLGMTCAACSNAVEKALLKLDGILSATVALLQNRAVIEYDSSRVKMERIKEAIEDAGFDAEILVEDINVPVSGAKKSITTGRFRITGLSCAACVASVEGILNSLDGVSSASVGLAAGMGEVSFDPLVINKNEIIFAIHDAGFEAEFIESERRNKVQLTIAGMVSDEDGKVVQNLCSQMKGLNDFVVEPMLERVELTFDPELIRLRTIVDSLESVGKSKFKVSLLRSHGSYSPDGKAEAMLLLQLLKSSLIFSIPVLFLGIICPQLTIFHQLLIFRCGPFYLVDWVKWALVTPVQFVIGKRFYVGAYRSLRNMSANMDVLVALGTTSAYVYSFFALIYSAITRHWLVMYFETTVMLINVILFGKYLEVVAKGKTSEAIGKLLKLAPTTAILLSVDLGPICRAEAPLR